MVSIVASVYNGERYVREMIESVIAQTYVKWELIIIDDASSDSTWEIMANYTDDRIIKIHNQSNVGLTVNLNRAIAMARGKYIARMDADDISFPNRLEKQVDFMERNPEVVLSGCWMMAFGKDNDIRQRSLDFQRLKINLMTDIAIFHPTFMIRRETLKRYHICYDESLRYAQDYNMQYKLSKVGKIVNIEDILVKYRIHDEQTGIAKQTQQLKCANETRKLILQDLGISLSDSDFGVWTDFCTFKIRKLSLQDIEVLYEIMEKIKSGNEVYKFYDTDLMIAILKSKIERYISECEADKIKQTSYERYYTLFLMLIKWMNLSQKGKKIEEFFIQRNIYTIAIYGMSHIGKLLFDQLSDSKVSVKYGIDQRIEVNYVSEKLPIYTIGNELPDVQMIVVTPINSFEEICTELRSYINSKIISLDKIIDELMFYTI